MNLENLSTALDRSVGIQQDIYRKMKLKLFKTQMYSQQRFLFYNFRYVKHSCSSDIQCNPLAGVRVTIVFSYLWEKNVHTESKKYWTDCWLIRYTLKSFLKGCTQLHILFNLRLKIKQTNKKPVARARYLFITSLQIACDMLIYISSSCIGNIIENNY